MPTVYGCFYVTDEADRPLQLRSARTFHRLHAVARARRTGTVCYLEQTGIP